MGFGCLDAGSILNIYIPRTIKTRFNVLISPVTSFSCNKFSFEKKNNYAQGFREKLPTEKNIPRTNSAFDAIHWNKKENNNSFREKNDGSCTVAKLPIYLHRIDSHPS